MTLLISLLRAALPLLMLVGALHAQAGLLNLDTWYQFNQNGRQPAQGCPPEDEFAPECFGSSGTPTAFANRAAWFVETDVPLELIVVDAFVSGDRFDVFTGLLFGDFAGTTSAPAFGTFADCGDDPLPCQASIEHSQGRFILRPDSSGTVFFTLLESADDELPFGSAYFRLERALVVALPPAPALVLAGLAALVLLLPLRRRRVRRLTPPASA